MHPCWCKDYVVLLNNIYFVILNLVVLNQCTEISIYFCSFLIDLHYFHSRLSSLLYYLILWKVFVINWSSEIILPEVFHLFFRRDFFLNIFRSYFLQIHLVDARSYYYLNEPNCWSCSFELEIFLSIWIVMARSNFFHIVVDFFIFDYFIPNFLIKVIWLVFTQYLDFINSIVLLRSNFYNLNYFFSIFKILFFVVVVISF